MITDHQAAITAAAAVDIHVQPVTDQATVNGAGVADIIPQVTSAAYVVAGEDAPPVTVKATVLTIS